MNKVLLLLLSFLLVTITHAQVGIGTASPDSSAMLEVQSTTKGFLMPRMTTAERNAIPNPAVGLFIFNTTDGCLQYYKGSSWSTCLVERSELPVITYASCLEYLNAGNTSDGVYSIDPDGPTGPDTAYDCYCDMTTEGGGWTLVASSRGAIDDQAIAYHSQLATLSPTTLNNGIWDGMRSVMGANSDIRFSASISAAGPPFNVDLAFFDCTWYDVLTASTSDASICFYTGNGGGVLHGLPARKNILNGDTRPLGDQWNYGYFEGEDFCTSTDDFTVDFDDRGMDGNQVDGTDWGEDDNTQKCGSVQGGTYSYFIWVRE